MLLATKYRKPFDLLEDNGITIPVLGVNCTYKYHVTFGDTIIIKPYVKEYSGVRMTVGYEITDKKMVKLYWQEKQNIVLQIRV